MTKELLIVFVKNIKLGKVKTRLAKTIGDLMAFEVYKELVETTEMATEKIAADKRIYFSDVVIDAKWPGCEKMLQVGEDLGVRMKNAINEGLEDGYEKVVLIGSDLPDIHDGILRASFDALGTKEVVFGPAEDGGYYLVGMKKMHSCIFENKPWSTESLLGLTQKELEENGVSIATLTELNDIDTFDDLEKSTLYAKFKDKIEIHAG